MHSNFSVTSRDAKNSLVPLICEIVLPYAISTQTKITILTTHAHVLQLYGLAMTVMC